jgi:hypothetical protein
MFKCFCWFAILDKFSTVHYLRVAYWLKMSQFLPHHCWPKGWWFFCSTLKFCNNEPGNFESIKTTQEVISHIFFLLSVHLLSQLWRNMRRDVWLSSMIYHWITLQSSTITQLRKCKKPRQNALSQRYVGI